MKGFLVALGFFVVVVSAGEAGQFTQLSKTNSQISVVGTGSAPQVPADPHQSSNVTPGRADDYISSIGVNTHYQGAFTAAQVATMMTTLGIRWFRDGSYQDGTDGLSWFEGVADGISTNQGVQGHMLLGYAPGNCAGIPALTTLVDDMWSHDKTKGRTLPTILYIEGPNEVDARGTSFSCDGTTGESAGNHAQIDLWNYVHTSGDPAVANVQVVMRPMANNNSSFYYSTAPSVLTSCGGGICADIQAAHDYMGDFGITNPDGTGSPGDFVSLQVYWYHNITSVLSSLPVFPTEFGWSSKDFGNKDSDAATQAIYCLEQLSDHWLFSRMGQGGYTQGPPFQQFIYELFDDNGQTDLGLFNGSGVIKPKGTALSNLTSILKDTGSTASTFTPTAISYTATGFPQDCHIIPLQKSNGRYEFLVWWETQVWDQYTSTDVAVTAQNITMTFGKTFSTIRYYDPISSTTAKGTVTNTNTISFSLAGHQLVVEAF